jgi:hypothetical protein
MRKTRPRTILSHIKDKGVRISYRIQGKQLLHFLHIGKTGGSAVKHSITHHSIDGRYAIYLHRHHFRLRDVPKGEKVFFFLRDPVSRFVSAFCFRQRQGKPTFFYPWSENEKVAFEEFSTPNELALALSSTQAGKRGKAQLAMKHIRHLKASYWNWFESEDYFKSRLSDIFFIGFQERLTEDFEILKLRIGLPENAELPSDDVQSNRNPDPGEKAIEDKGVANLKHWYKADFQFIALCEQLIRHQNLDCSSVTAQQGVRAGARTSRH